MGRASPMSMVAPAVSARDEDHELVAAVRAGDDRAFELLYERYRARITAFVQGYVKDYARAEDVTQEVFFSALRRMRATDAPIAFRAWIHEIARNACIDQFRRSSSRAQELSFDEGDGLPPADRNRLVAPGGAPEDAADDAERLNDLYGALGDLSESHHRILVLRELEGRSYQEIAERMGMSKAGVESTLFRARKRLNEQYDDIATGRRCVRVRTVVALAGESDSELRARDQRSVGRHLSHCTSCRAFVRSVGVDVDVPERSWLAERLRILFPLPLPAFLRRGPTGHRGDTSARLGAALGPQAEPLGNGAAKIATAAAALAVAVLGTGIATHQIGPGGSPGGSTPADRPSAALRPAVLGGFAANGGRRVVVRSGQGAGASTPKPRRSQASAKGGASTRGSAKSGSKTGKSGGSSAGGSSSSSGGGGTADGGSASSGSSSSRSSGGGAGGTVRRTGQTVGGAVQNAGQGAGGAVQNAGQTVGGAVQQTGQSVGQTVGGASPAAGGAVSGATGTAGGAVSGATGTAGGAVSGATGTAGGAVSGATGTAGGAVGGLTGGG